MSEMVKKAIQDINRAVLLSVRDVGNHSYEIAYKLFGVSREFVVEITSLSIDECQKLSESLVFPLFEPSFRDDSAWDEIASVIKRGSIDDKCVMKINLIAGSYRNIEHVG